MDSLSLLQNLLDEGGLILFQWKHAENWPVESVSDNVISLFEYSAKEFLQGEVLYADCIHPEDLERVSREVASALDNKLNRFSHTPYRIITKSKQIHWVSDSTIIIRDESDEVTHFQGIIQDITEEQQVKNALHFLHNRFELALETTQDGISDWNPLTDEVFFSPQWKSMLGYEEHEIGNDLSEWSKRVHPDDLDKAMADVQAHLEGRTPYYINRHRLRCKDGSYKWILDRGKALRDESGKPIRMVGFHTDLTELEELRNAYQNSQSELEKERQRFALAVEGSRDGLFDWNMTDNTMFTSERFATMLGYRPEELPGTIDAWRDLLHPEDKEQAWQTVCDYLEQSDHAVYESVFRMRTKEGGYRWILGRGKALFNANRQPVRFVGFNTDITRQKELELNLERYSHELADQMEEEIAKRIERDKLLIQQSKMAAMGEMIGAIAHQWKQPLNVVSVIADTVEMCVEDQAYDDIPKHIETIHEQIQFMSSTINDFKNFFSPQKHKSTFLACEAIQEMLRILAFMIKHSNMQVTFQKCNEKCYIYGYPNEFKQVILNIISNTKDACEEKGIKKPKLHFSLEKSGERQIIRCRDNAGGIPEEFLPHKVFENRFTTKGNRGTGIGLALSKTMVEENMNGKLWVHNVEGGAEFVIELPVTGPSVAFA